MLGKNDHPDKLVNEALTYLCVALIQWERATGRQSAFIIRENNGEMPGRPMEKPGYVLRVANGLPIGRENDDIPDSHILAPMTWDPT